jgi:hypothetical protein
MALQKIEKVGYGQIELNNVAFRRDGRIEAQCAPNATDFEEAYVENGMLLAVDAAKRTVNFAKDGSLPIALVYSAEHAYDFREQGLKNFKLNGKDDFLPRLGYTAIGDKFTTNCLAYDDSDFSTEDLAITALKACATTAIYGCACSNGAIKITKTAPAYGPVYRVINAHTMPDGQVGLQFQHIPEIAG